MAWEPFAQADSFLAAAARVQAIVAKLSPRTKVNVDEIGSIGACGAPGVPRWFFNAIGAVYAYTYARLASLGVEIMAASQLTAYPGGHFPGGLSGGNFPCVTMLDWRDGSGTARFWTLKMMIDVLGGAATRKALVATEAAPAGGVFAQGIEVRAADGGQVLRRTVLLVNKKNESATVTVTSAAGAAAAWVDYSAGYAGIPYGSRQLGNDGTLSLDGWAVAIVTLRKP